VELLSLRNASTRTSIRPYEEKRNFEQAAPLSFRSTTEATMARGALLWLLGVPIPIIILLWLIWH
jgi:hypothetical protein